jgi:MFS transporter, ACS family, solute carrier family 17 (sodium-dependent inorganic phosphate cotransporter), other
MSDAARASAAVVRAPVWPRRYTIVALFFLATMLCYVDRVSISVAIIPLAREKHYNAAAQGVILSAFFWGYIWLQLVGGWMADRFGGKRVLATGVALWSAATFLTPAATAGFLLLLAARAMLGIGESLNFPAIHSIAARWTLASERGRALGLNFSAMFLGTVAAFLVSPAIIVALGWRALFYISGALGAIWVVVWLAKAADRPEASSGVSPAELAEIIAGGGDPPPAEQVPWARIVREKAVWAIVLAHFCHNWGFNILLLWLPTYLDQTFHVPMKRLGALSLVPWLVTFVASNASGWISDALCVRGLGRTTVRKVVQTVAFTLGAIPLLILPAAGSPASAIALVSVSAAANSLGLAAFGINHLDVAPRYAGILMGVSNTIATFPGIIGVAAAGLIWQATGSFAGIFYLTAAVYIVGAAGYLRWGTGEQRI